MLNSYFFKFKNIAKASEYTGLVINYVLSGNLIVVILDHWVLCCGRRAVTRGLHGCN